jgi:hypothetical protein
MDESLPLPSCRFTLAPARLSVNHRASRDGDRRHRRVNRSDRRRAVAQPGIARRAPFAATEIDDDAGGTQVARARTVLSSVPGDSKATAPAPTARSVTPAGMVMPSNVKTAMRSSSTTRAVPPRHTKQEGTCVAIPPLLDPPWECCMRRHRDRRLVPPTIRRRDGDRSTGWCTADMSEFLDAAAPCRPPSPPWGGVHFTGAVSSTVHCAAYRRTRDGG